MSVNGVLRQRLGEDIIQIVLTRYFTQLELLPLQGFLYLELVCLYVAGMAQTRPVSPMVD